MAQSLYLRERAERFRGLTRRSADAGLRDSSLELATRVAALQGIERPAENTSSDDQGAA
jgi:hypothetical protein